VALGYTHALFLYGPGGHGKSHIVQTELDQVPGKGKWKQYKGDMSSRGLIDRLEEYFEAVHVLEDMEKTLKQDEMQSVLRAAMASPKGGPRRITDTKHRRKVDFVFHGGIIIVSNDPIDYRYGRLGAIASRTHPMLWRLSQPEMAAMMRAIALRGFRKLTPEECMQVAEFVIQEMESRQADTKVDLRIFCDGALPDYLQWKEGKSVAHWSQVVRARIQGEPLAECREDRLVRHREIDCRIRCEGRTSEEEIRIWRTETGLAKTAFYDRLKEAALDGLLERYKLKANAAKIGKQA
jgi:hypothetical protein